MCPERFPMVDSWIAKWVVSYRAEYSAEASGLAAPSESFLARRKTTLTVPGDWPFYEGWNPILPNGGQHSYAANRISVARSRYRDGCIPERAFRITPAPAHRMTRMVQTPVQAFDPAY